MKDDVNKGIFHSPVDPCRHCRSGHGEMRMRCCSGNSKLVENIILDIQRTVLKNIHFSAFENTKVSELFVERINTLHLFDEPTLVQTMHDREALGMIGNRDIGQSRFFRRMGHFFN